MMEETTGKLNWGTFVRFVQQWAHDRNLIKGSTVQAQALKGLSELGELADNLAKGKCIKDDVGDNCVVAVIVDTINGYVPTVYAKEARELTEHEIMSNAAHDWAYYLDSEWAGRTDIPEFMWELCQIKGIDFEECLFTAWSDIKDRKGIMHQGVFIKESDPRYKELVSAP